MPRPVCGPLENPPTPGETLTEPKPILYSESPTTIADVIAGLAALGVTVNGLEASALLTLTEGTWYQAENHMMRRLASLGLVEQSFGATGQWRVALNVQRLLTRLGVPTPTPATRRLGAPPKPEAERRTKRIPGYLTDEEAASIAHLTPEQIRRRILAPWSDSAPADPHV